MKKQAVRQRTISTPVDRVKFALRFAGDDLNSFRPGDWLNLRDDASQFFGIEGVSQLIVDTTESANRAKAQMLKENRGKPLAPGRLPRPMKGTGVTYSQSALALDDTHAVLGAPMGKLPWDYEPADWLHLQADVNKVLHGEPVELSALRFALVGGGAVLYTSGQTHDVFLAVLLLLLARQGGENIAQCPQCAKVFWREMRRQKFCSRRCANLASVNAFNDRKKKAAKQAAKARRGTR